MRYFASIVADRSMSGPGCNWRVFITKRPYAARPSSDDFTAWHEGRISDTKEEAMKVCSRAGVAPEDVEEHW